MTKHPKRSKPASTGRRPMRAHVPEKLSTRRVKPKVVAIHVPDRGTPVVVMHLPLAHVEPMAKVVEVEVPEGFWRQVARFFTG